VPGWDRTPPRRGPRIDRGEQPRRAGWAHSDARKTTLPLSMDQLVRVSRVDLEAEILRCLGEGLRTIRIGLGTAVDIRLLDDDLLAADVRLVDRELEILIVHAEAGFGYTLHRGASNFGVYWGPSDAAFPDRSVRRHSQVAGLVGGDRVGLGSTPAEALRFALPRLSDLPSGLAPADERASERFRIALCHWRYRVVTFGGHPNAVLRFAEPELSPLRAALVRELDAPDGYRLMALVPAADLAVARRGSGIFVPLSAGDLIQLPGGGHRLRFGGVQVVLPEPVAPTPRFSARVRPTLSDVADVFGLDDLDDPTVVRARYRELVRELHPDRNREDPGHTSRFHEVQACWEIVRSGSGRS
jgi:hypothetical protein